MNVTPQHRLLASIILVVLFCAPVLCQAAEQDTELEGDLRCHDPHVAKEGGKYYLFSTGSREGFIPIRCSSDLKHWSLCGHVFDTIPAWAKQEIPEVRGAWAPDPAFFSGKWHVYYSVSTFGKNRSVIGVATNRTLDPTSKDYQWVNQGKVIESFPQDDWNAIDANTFIDEKGQVWMDFGSFWGGVKMIRIDPETGRRPANDTTLYSLASRPRKPPISGSIEGSYVFRRGDYYYLFASFDFCCKGVNSTYNIRVGRARRPLGPYLDKDGRPMMEGGGTLLQEGDEQWRGPGHQSVLHDESGDYIFFHAYHGKTGKPYLQIGRLEWKDDWPEIVSVWRPSVKAAP